jgi:hypothetical protein
MKKRRPTRTQPRKRSPLPGGGEEGNARETGKAESFADEADRLKGAELKERKVEQILPPAVVREEIVNRATFRLPRDTTRAPDIPTDIWIFGSARFRAASSRDPLWRNAGGVYC